MSVLVSRMDKLIHPRSFQTTLIVVWGLIDQSVHFSTFLVKETAAGPEMAGMFQAVIEGIGDASMVSAGLTRIYLCAASASA